MLQVIGASFESNLYITEEWSTPKKKDLRMFAKKKEERNIKLKIKKDSELVLVFKLEIWMRWDQSFPEKKKI